MIRKLQLWYTPDWTARRSHLHYLEIDLPVGSRCWIMEIGSCNIVIVVPLSTSLIKSFHYQHMYSKIWQECGRANPITSVTSQPMYHIQTPPPPPSPITGSGIYTKKTPKEQVPVEAKYVRSLLHPLLGSAQACCSPSMKRRVGRVRAHASGGHVGDACSPLAPTPPHSALPRLASPWSSIRQWRQRCIRCQSCR